MEIWGPIKHFYGIPYSRPSSAGCKVWKDANPIRGTNLLKSFMVLTCKSAKIYFAFRAIDCSCDTMFKELKIEPDIYTYRRLQSIEMNFIYSQ